MDKFLKRNFASMSQDRGKASIDNTSNSQVRPSIPEQIDLHDLPSDPADRKKILEYHPNQRDEIRRKYLIRGPCQPRGHDFPKKMIGNKLRRFNPVWFDQYADWLEYSIKKDGAFCLCCYLFREQIGNDAFVTDGFSSWNKTERLSAHVGDVNSFHNNARKKCDDLMRQDQSIVHAMQKQSDIMRNEYRIRLNASISSSRFLLKQGLPFRGHDESENSDNKGNFLELVKYTAEQNDIVSKVILKNAPGNSQMVSPTIQKDIAQCFAEQITQDIIQEIGHDVFGLLVDESSDVSDKEQMAVVFRFVDKNGIVKERFIELIHVKETSALSLKSAIDSLFAKYGLSLKQVRGQGYDGASNMKGEFNGLRSLISRESRAAYYVHCFAHQLQLVVVAVAKELFDVGNFFDMISLLLSVVGGSCKRKDMIRESHRIKVNEEINNGEISTGTGLNQDITLQRPGNTRWGSHYKTLLRLVELFSSIIEVLEYVENDGTDTVKRRQAYGLLKYFHTFDFVFYLQLMLLILGLTDNLSMALQRKDQDILNAISLVKSTKRQLQQQRDAGWNLLLDNVSSFCEKHNIEIINMEEDYVGSRRLRKKPSISNLHHYQIDCFYTVMDFQLREFNDRFDEMTSVFRSKYLFDMN
ncbi:PREDICTED: zinc finger MYM-type protein 1-like [Tarenaya hassleriana]|uniref:zinc finger MYM-type protein 1-like n=1 Tax=Tarenaya hassleriana TaxID=28532 RepID=UPI00053CA123|nr:PREDICTED: zinc finger MYM-type protein 1-like [Tarenaya hassleriana]XP_019056397.1 PREDICTED: zinc finger MYM-type protein 1-like [Tarenaya hassleriana]